jgi:hypothetical protein
MTLRAPIFVVGLPRSGSTLVSRLLNESSQILCVNDLYYLQAVLASGGFAGRLEGERATRMLDHLIGVVAERSSSNDRFIGQFRLPGGALRGIRSEVAPLVDRSPTWHELMDATLGRVARAAGKRVWADKTPQNFFHVETLRRAFPGARFVFVLRDPRSVLASYKFARGAGHDPRRYHPFPYALYWRKAARRYLALRGSPDVHLVSYERLVRSPDEVVEELTGFLEVDLAAPGLSEIGDNSSFAESERRRLTATETWICERTCGREMARLGCPPGRSSPSFSDLPEVMRLGLRFLGFQAGRALRDADARRRMGVFLQRRE